MGVKLKMYPELPEVPAVRFMNAKQIRRLRPIDWAALILFEIKFHSMKPARAMNHLDPDLWYSKHAKQGACIAQQVFVDHL